MNGMQLIAGSSHLDLARKISELLGVHLTPVLIKNFADGEKYIRIEEKVRGEDVFIIQSLTSPVNDNLMELLILIDALKRSSAGRINLICPYVCYSRQDRRVQSHEAITAKLVADLITKAGADRLITIDLHADQIQGFYDIPVDHLVGYPIFAKYLKSKKKYKDIVVVSPDMGGVKRANKMADLLHAPIAIIDKVRKEHNKSEVSHVVGDVKNKTAVLVDDIIDTGGSICGAAKVIKEYGASDVIICATHALLNGEAVEKLSASEATKILVLNSVPISQDKKFKKLKVLSVAPLLSKIIYRIHNELSLGELFTWENESRVL